LEAGMVKRVTQGAATPISASKTKAAVSQGRHHQSKGKKAGG
jgi:hypothetical protein